MTGLTSPTSVFRTWERKDVRHCRLYDRLSVRGGDISSRDQLQLERTRFPPTPNFEGK